MSLEENGQKDVSTQDTNNQEKPEELPTNGGDKSEEPSLDGIEVNGNGHQEDKEDIESNSKIRNDEDHDEEEDESESESSEEEEEEDESESESSEEEEEEDEDPPMLKYSRLTQLPKTFFNKELISGCLIHESVFAFGTASGLLYLTNTNLESIGTIRARKSPILSIHTDGSYIAAASMDGTIVIASIAQIKNNNQSSTVAYDIKTPIYSVVLNGNYKDTRSFIYGNKGGQVILSHTNWLGSRTERVLGQDTGPIVGLTLKDEILIWMSDDGITIYNLLNDTAMSMLKRPKGSPPAELIWPRVNFQEHDRLLIGWVNHIWCIRLDTGKGENNNFKLSSAMSSFQRPNSEASITVETEYSIDGLIAGIGSFKDDSLMILTIPDEQKSSPPELRIIKSVLHEEVSTDEIVLKGYESLRINDFHLGQYIGPKSSKYFIISATDSIIAEEFDLMRRFNWLVERERFLEAWEMSEHLITKEERCNVGIRQVQVYLDDENWDQAAKFLKQVLIKDSSVEDQQFKSYLLEKWEQWSWIFIHSGKLEKLAAILPVEDEGLPNELYNKCLESFLEYDTSDKIFEYLDHWDVKLYDYKHIEQLIENKLEVEPDLSTLRRCLAELYLKTNEPSSAITHFIELKGPVTIDLLDKNHLVSHFIDSLPKIVRFEIGEDDLENAPITILGEKLSHIIDILVDNRHEVLPSRIVPLMNSNGLNLITFLYLQKISTVDPFLVESYETEMVELFADFDRSQLLTYLKRKQNYNIDKVMEIMKQRNFNHELVYLLGKIGRSKEAMYLIVEKMDDPKQAIEFATEQKSQELWSIFLEYGINKPNFIKVLIEYTGILFDPQILKKIPESVEIEDLKNSLIRITRDNELTLSIHRSILQILENEAIEISDKLNELRVKGKVVEPNELFAKFREVLLLHNGELKAVDN